MPTGIYINRYEIIFILFLLYTLLFKFKELNIFFDKYIRPSYGQLLTGILFLFITAIIVPFGISNIAKINKINDLYIIGSSNNIIGKRYLDSVSASLVLMINPYADLNKSYTVELLPDYLSPNSKIQNDVYKAYTENLAIMEQIKILSDELSDQVFGVENLQLNSLELDKLYYIQNLLEVLNSKEKRIYQNKDKSERFMNIRDVLHQIDLTKEQLNRSKKDRLFFTNDILKKLQTSLYKQLTLLILSIFGIYLAIILFIVWIRLSYDEKIKWLKVFFSFPR